MILFAILQRGASSSYQWGKWLLLVMALLALFWPLSASPYCSEKMSQLLLRCFA
jgi:hypothetical protein